MKPICTLDHLISKIDLKDGIYYVKNGKAHKMGAVFAEAQWRPIDVEQQPLETGCLDCGNDFCEDQTHNWTYCYCVEIW